MLLSPFTPPSPSWPVPWAHKSVAMSVSLLLPCKQIHQYHLSGFHIFLLIYDICFSLSDLLGIYPEETKIEKGKCYPSVHCNTIYSH